MGALVWYVAFLFALDVLVYLARGVVKLCKDGRKEFRKRLDEKGTDS